MGKSRFDELGVRHLRALVAVAEEGTFQRAGARLGFSQAAISQQIGALERAIGALVFERPGGPRPVRLTRAGEVLLEQAHILLEQFDEADRQVGDLLAGRGMRLRVGAFQSVSVRLLPRIITELRCSARDLDIQVHESEEGAALIELVLKGDLDLSFVIGPIHDERLNVTSLCHDRFVAMVPRADPQAASGVYPLASLDRRACIGQEAGSVCQQLIEDGLRSYGAVPRFVFRTNDNAAVQAMVRAGVGVAVMPELAVDAEDPEIAVLRLQPAIPPREIAIVTHRSRPLPEVGRRLIDLAVAACALPGFPRAVGNG